MYTHSTSYPPGTVAGTLTECGRQLIEAKARIADLEGAVRAAIAETHTIAQITDDPERVKMLATNLVDFLRKDFEADMAAETAKI